MSQYLQDGSTGGGSAAVPRQTNAVGTGSVSTGTSGVGSNSASETSLSEESESSAGLEGNVTSTDSMFSSENAPVVIPPGDGHCYSFPYGSGKDSVHNSAAEGGVHGFGPRQQFGSPKQLPPHQPHRFVGGPQPSGPTPTLNQLLQRENSMSNRYQNNYTHPEQHYNQSWSPQKLHQQTYSPGSGSTPPTSFRTQQTLSPAYGGSNAPSQGYGENRPSGGGWPGSNTAPSQHGPGSPGQQNSSASVSQPSPQPSQPPSHSPGPGPGMPPSPQHHQAFPTRPAPPTTPNAHAPDAAVFNSHVPPQDTYRSKKTDSLSKLYEMDDSPDRRAWLDKLLAFMDDRRTPITTCPTISKNPLDLFRLYMYVKDRGGFMEVTKNKTWKDIAGMLGIGASSSAAYTLRKHYTKNLLAFECQFDRGGIDPQPIINQVEASSKKKSAKATSVPSPGSSNSQDSFPPGSGSASLDGYGNYNGYPSSGNPDYPPQRPSSQSAPSPHSGSGSVNHLGTASRGPSPAGGAADNVSVSNPFDDVSPSPSLRGGPFPGGPHSPYPSGSSPRPPGQNYSGQPGYQYPGQGPGISSQNAPPDQYSSYSSASGDATAATVTSNSGQAASTTTAQDPYRYNSNPSSVFNPRPPYSGTQNNTASPTSQAAGSISYPGHQDYYRPDQQNTGASGYTGGPPNNKNMPPPGPQPPRRHPDFAKDQPYPPYGQPRTPMYGGWANNNQYRPPQYGGPTNNQTPSPQWNQGNRPVAPWPANQGYQGTQPNQPQWQPVANQGGQNSSIRPVHRPGKPFPPMMPPVGNKTSNPGPVSNAYGHNQMPKREITFPPDSVENVAPVIYRRKRIYRADVGPVDAWRLIMCLRSGLLTESTYALDMLNILLYDDSSVGYFGLSQWPGLLDLLLAHFKRNLLDIFDGPYPAPENEDEKELDLGGVVKQIDPNLKHVILSKTTNYTLMSRKGDPVKFVERDEDIFVHDNLKDWDLRGEVNNANTVADIPSDPWYTNEEHILPNFQAEFGRIPFHMKLEKSSSSSNSQHEVSCQESVPPSDEAPSPKVSDKKRIRTKTLSDVISRIKKDSTNDSDVNVLMLESTTVDKLKTEVVCENNICEEPISSVDLNISVNGEYTCGSKTKVEREKPICDPASSLKRRRLCDYEDESYSRDEASLVLFTESQDNVGKRCVCLSNILRNLTFVPGNETEFARSTSFLALVGKLLLLHHEHPPRTQKTRNYDREEDADFADSCSSLQGENEWWWDFLAQTRENILVCIANISGQINVSLYDEEVARPLLDGLLHWAICPSATAQDPFPSVGPSSLLSPQRLALEALCKLCVTNSNVDLVIATPPFSRLERLCAVLTKNLCRSEDQVLREFSINLLHYLAAADSSMARVVASQTPCVSLLVAFIEQAEQSALGVANAHGISALRDNPDSMGTSLDMLRRAAATLVFLSRHSENRALLVQQESRLLALVMSQILDQQVALLISKVLYQISRS